MKDKKPKKLKVVSKINKRLKKQRVERRVTEIIKIADKKNIFLEIFKTLLDDKDLDWREYQELFAVIKLLQVKMYLKLFEIDEPEVVDLIKTTLDKYKKITKQISKNTNWEAMIADEHFLKGQDLYLFKNDDTYHMIASIFAMPFKIFEHDQYYYDLGYFLSMYITLEVFVNKYNIPKNYEIYLAKLDVQLRMIRTFSNIAPKTFNISIKALNKWFDKVEKKEEIFKTKKKGEQK
ncbi:hypothetical protein [Mesoplasma lactucae]|uniref:Uncharacterized protein n=1 Tax=Mesoplasma lactucae ATCC 49193 TaxID=81460 RepID=A0A291ISI7_9MOLU|nr:hypothetical protein [Mesoplasma lactucae]ATG97769.1 hypothetical protein CP520_03465 [Mesoplasma lactucae ATCC 49193]ATZ20454.1 hypothetical protein MLACT_v1c06330 [Mesoplasma lactucae ATCC 49193]MCL8216626.1 hypothetical protein [Mesoplasma lactucae ATCC 49193]